jgi:hypothetical protein
MAKIYGFKASDGEPKGVAVNDDGELIVNANYPAASYTPEAVYDTVDLSTGGAITGGDDFTVWYNSWGIFHEKDDYDFGVSHPGRHPAACTGFGRTGGGVRMTLTEAHTKKINDLGIGKNVTSKISVYDQIAALRKQVAAISAAMKVPLEADFKALEDLVASEKAKKEKKVETVKPKKASAKKSKWFNMRRHISPAQEADLRRLYFSEYKKRIKAGEHSPFAAMMADLAQLAERNRIYPVIFWWNTKRLIPWGSGG